MTRVPELRFDGFAGEWEENIFDNLAEYKKGPFGSALKKSIFVPKSNETVKVYEQQNAIEKNWELERYFITREYANKMENFNVGPGDLIVSCAGTIGEMYELPNSAEEGIINQALMRIRVKDAIDKRFFNHIFDKMIRKSSARLSNGSAIKNIPPFSDLKPHKTYVPIYNEQEKIGDLFSKIDQLIENQQELVDQTMAFKKSMLQKMFPKKDSLVPKFRFDGFDNDWMYTKLDDILIKNNKKNKKLEIDYVESVSNKHGFIKQTEQFEGYQLASADLSNYYIIEPKTFAYNPSRINVGSIGYKKSFDKTSVVSPLYVSFSTKELIDDYFIWYLFKTDNFEQQRAKFSEGGVRDTLSFNALSNFEMKIPTFKEQEKIGNFFKKIDKKIAKEEKLLELYKDMKKSLLQKMFV